MQKAKLAHRVLALFLCFSLLFGLVPGGFFIELLQVNATPAAQGTDQNTLGLKNGDFENGLEYWDGSSTSGATTDIIAEGAYEGQSVLFTASSTNENKAINVRKQSIEIGDATTIRLSAVSKLVSGKAKAYIGLWFYDAAGKLVPENTAYTMPIGYTAQWQEDVLTQEVPAGAVTVVVEMGNPSNANCAYMIDNVKVVFYDENEPIPTEPVCVFTELFDTFNKIGSSANRKAGPLGWTDSDINNENLVRCYDGESAVDGHALHFQSADDLWAYSPSIDVQAGYEYHVTFMAKKSLNNTAYTGQGKLVFVDSSGKEIPGTGNPVGLTYGSWVNESFTAIAPAGAVKAYLYFSCSTESGAYGIDNLTVTQSAEPAQILPDATEPDPSIPPVDSGFSVTNGDFENGFDSWVRDSSTGGNIELITDCAYQGQSLLFTAVRSDTDKAINNISQTLQIGDVECIRLSAVSRLVSGKAKAYMGLWFYDVNGNLVPKDTAYTTAIGYTTDWNENVLIQTVPEGAVTVAVEIGNPSNATCEYIVDDIRIEACIPGEPEDTLPTEGEDPTIPTEGGNDYDGFVFYDKFDDFNLIGGRPNRQAGPLGWIDSDVNNEHLVRCYDGESAVSGHALHFQSADNLWAQSPLFDVKEGYDYTVKFMAKKSINNTVFTGFIKVVFVDEAGNEVGIRLRYVGRTFGKWVEESVIAVAPENAKKAYIVFECRTPNGAYGIDDLTVTESEAPSQRDPLATEPDDLPASTILALQNGDFEGGEQYWTGFSASGGTVSLVTDNAYNGHSLLFVAVHTDTDKSNNYRAQTVDVGDHKAIQVSAMSKLVSGNAKAYLGLWFYDKNGDLVPENTAFTIPVGYTEQWHEDTLIQAVPEGAVTVKIEFGNFSNATSTYMVDDVKISAYTGPEENINPPYAPEPPEKEDPSSIPIVDPSELNASFEKLNDKGMPIGWRTTGYGKFTLIEADDAPNGKYYAQIEKTEDGAITLRSPRITCTPGTTYELKVMARDLLGKCYVGIYVYDENGICLEDASKIVSTDGSGKWKIYTVLTQLPENAAGIEFEAWASSKVTEYKVQIDAVMMRISEEVIKEPYVPTPYTYPTVEELLENISDVYPRIYFTPEEAKQIKLRRFNGFKTKYGWTWNSQYETLLAQAENFMKVERVSVSMNTGKSIMMDIYPILKDPNDEDYKQIYINASIDDEGNMYELPYTGFGCLITDHLREMMKTWSMAYVMTGKRVYAERAISFAMQIADWDWWGDYEWTKAKGIAADASVAWMMEGMVAVYDMCHDQLTEEQAKKLERNIIEKGLIPLSKQVDPMDTSNGNMMYCGGILSGFAAIVNKENAEEIYPYLQPGLLTMHNALDIYAFSGNTEGHYYTDFGLETFMPGVGHLYRTTQMEDILDHPFLTEILPYWTIMWAANLTGSHPCYSDAGINAYMKIPMAVLSKLTNDPLIDGFLINAGGTGNVFNNLVYLNPEPQPEYLTDYAGVIENFGYGALRTGFAADDLLLTLKANDSQMHHNHYDQNSIQFAFNGTWLIQDPGVGSYYYSNRVFWTHEGHSTILVDNNAQMELGGGSTKLVFNNNLYSYIIGSAADSYGSDFDGKVLEKFDRHAIQVNHEDKGYYLVIDDLLSAKDRVYTWQMYNGARQLFSVDGEDVPEGTLVMGNKVSMPIGKNILNVNFIDSEPLQIGDQIYKAGEQPVGLTLVANSAASKSHQFMTLISIAENFNSNFISFYEILGGERFTNPDRIAEGEISWDSSMPLGQEIVKGNMIGTTPCVFFRGNKAGDWIEIPFTIDETGIYDVTLSMGVSDGCCRVKATFDDTLESDVFDCSGLPETFIDIPFGERELKAGQHKVKLEVVGPGLDEDYEPGWYLINAGGIDLMRVGVEIPESNDMEVVEVIDTKEAIAGLVNYIDNKFDFLMFNRTNGAATAGLMNTDAQQASVLGLINGAITEGFAATNATTLVYNGKVLFLAEKKVDIVASNTGWQIRSEEAQTVQLTAISPELDYVITVNGETTDATIENGILTVAVDPGETDISVVLSEPEVEPTEPATEPSSPATEPSEAPTVAPTEPVADNDTSGVSTWFIVGILLLLLTGAVTGFVLFLNKRKNATK